MPVVQAGCPHLALQDGCAAQALAISVCVAFLAGLATLEAPMTSIVVTKNSEVLFSLPGYDSAGSRVRRLPVSADCLLDVYVRWLLFCEYLLSCCPRAMLQLTTYITSIPAVGTLYQISQIFSDYGYEPKRGLAITSANSSVPVAIIGSRNRLLYVPPPNMNEPLEKVRAPLATAWRVCQRTLCVNVRLAVPQWATFTYKMADRSTTSQQGIVWLVPPHKNIVMSDFAVSLDGWSVIGNGARAAASTAGGLSYEPFSRGVLNHYVLATDAEINTNKKTKADDTLWYFVAPSKFHGMHNIAYGGQLSFAISSAAGAV